LDRIRLTARWAFALIVLAFGAGGLLVLFATPREAPATQGFNHQVLAPMLARDGQNPTSTPRPPTPTPVPTYGDPVSITLQSAGLSATAQIERRHTKLVGGREQFEDPSHPARIAWYHRYATLGRGGHNTIMAAHVNYFGHGAGPFVNLRYARIGDDLRIRTADGKTLRYTVLSVRVIKLSNLDMDRVVYPGVPLNRERITLISCGGTFIPRAGGGGDYDSRVVLYAERILP
jgi:hypothetical protein